VKIELFSPDCSVPMTFWNKFYVKMFIPVIFALVFIVAALTELMCKRIKSPKNYFVKSSSLTTRAYAYVIFFGVTLYTFVLSSLLSPFQCVKQTNGEYFIDSYPAELCFQGNWNKNLPAVIFFALIYVIAFPTCLTYVMYCYGRGDGVDTLWFSVRFGLITRPYRKEVYYWELVNLLRKAAFVLSTSFWQSTSSSYETKLMTTLILLFVFLWLDIFVSPFIQGTRFTAAT
jgi:hypothetical protein